MIRTKKTKLLAMLLVLCMLLGLFPAAVAEETVELIEEPMSEEGFDAVMTEGLTDAEAPVEAGDLAEVSEETEEVPAEEAGAVEELSVADPFVVEDTAAPAPSDEPEETLPADGSMSDEELPEAAAEPEPDAELTEPEEADESENLNEEEEELLEEEEEEPSEETLFPGLPEGYVLSEAELAAKAELSSRGILASLENSACDEGVVLVLTESPEYAAMTAEAYDADLLSFEGSFARLRLRSATTAEAVKAAADMTLPLPAVEPDWIVELEPDWGDVSFPAMFAAAADSPLDWYDWVKTLGLNDPYVQNPAQDYQWMHDAIHSYAAWGVTMGSPAITVAVIDTGIASGHEDLGTVLSGWNTLTDSADTEDDSGHGTRVAGIIAAQGFNGTGGVGIAPGVNILPVRVLSNNSGTNSSTAKGINWAVEHGADIINLSLGGTAYSGVVERAVQNAWEHGVTVVAAMCNASYGGSNIQCYPASLNHVIAVTASDRTGSLASYSHYGAWADIMAPGSNILSTNVYNSYRTDSGTSMATPVVTGAIALYMSAYGKQNPDTMEYLVRTAVTNGVLDAGKLLAGDGAAPVFAVGEEKTAVTGSQVSMPESEKLYILPKGADNGARILYTLDGTFPAMLNGQIRSGTLLPAGESVPLDKFSVGQTVTVRALCISGIGTAGKTASLRIQITGSPSPEVLSLEITSAPKTYLAAGRPLLLQAKLSSSQGRILNQSVIWSLVSQDEGLGARLTAAGYLMTDSGKSGSLTVRATSRFYPDVSSDVTITIQNVQPVWLMSMSETRLNLLCSESLVGQGQLTAHCFDSARNELNAEEVGIRWTSTNPAVAEVDGNGLVTARGRGAAMVRAEALDGSGRSAFCTVIVTQAVTEISVTAQEVVAPGGYVLPRATLLPLTAGNRMVNWRLGTCSEADLPVSINAAGMVTVGRTAPEGAWFEVIADAKDGSGVTSDPLRIEISPRAESVSISWDTEPASITKDYFGRVTGGVLWLRAEQYADLQLTAVRNYRSGGSLKSAAGAILWSSTNPAVAAVDENGLVTATGAGIAVIMARANDGSGRFASFQIRVIRPVSSITLVSGALLNSQCVAFGRSVQVRAGLGDAYGTPDNRILNWSFRVYPKDGLYYDEELTETMRSRRMITLNTSGLLTVSAAAASYDIRSVEVMAETTDGSKLSSSIEITVVQAPTSLELREYAITSSSLNIFGKPGIQNLYLNNQGGSSVSLLISSDGEWDGYAVSSSNPDVAGATLTKRRYRDDDGIWRTCPTLEITSGMKAGTALIYVRTCDGSNRVTTVTVQVKSKN